MSLYVTTDKKPTHKEDLLIANCLGGQIYYSDEPGSLVVNAKEICPIPIVEKGQIYSAYISGLSGSRKSTFAAMMIQQLMQQKSNKIENIFLVSQTKDAISDPAYSELSKMTKKVKKFDKKLKKDVEELDPIMIQLDISSPLIYEQDISFWKNSIFLFDDIDGLTGDVKKMVKQLHDTVLTTGRKQNIHVITIFHQVRNYSQTGLTLTESQHKIIFPKVNRQKSMSFLKDYMKFDDNVIKKIYSSVDNKENRWLIIRDVIPSFIMTANYVELL